MAPETQVDPTAQARVAIARDALRQQRRGKIIPWVNQYFAFSGNKRPKFFQENFKKQARDVRYGKCTTCVLGGLLVARAHLFNHVTLEQLSSGSIGLLFDFFSHEQIDQLEAAFEGKSYNFATGGAQIYNNEWIIAMPNHAERWRAILRNIVRNGGTFVPSDIQK